jgi:hypothetical protein
MPRTAARSSFRPFKRTPPSSGVRRSPGRDAVVCPPPNSRRPSADVQAWPLAGCVRDLRARPLSDFYGRHRPVRRGVGRGDTRRRGRGGSTACDLAAPARLEKRETRVEPLGWLQESMSNIAASGPRLRTGTPPTRLSWPQHSWMCPHSTSRGCLSSITRSTAALPSPRSTCPFGGECTSSTAPVGSAARRCSSCSSYRSKLQPHGVSGIPPPRPGLRQGEVPAGAREGENSFGDSGYGGPCPPEGDPPHRYVFTLYAVTSTPELASGASLEQLRAAIAETAIARGRLTGRFAR